MSLLNDRETELVNELLIKTEQRATSAQRHFATTALSSGVAYAVRWAKDALEAEARFKALGEVLSFYTIDLPGNPEEGRARADQCATRRTTEKLGWICNGTTSETEQVRDAQAYAWAKAEFDMQIGWARVEAARVAAQ
jgi:hypothetical protein